MVFADIPPPMEHVSQQAEEVNLQPEADIEDNRQMQVEDLELLKEADSSMVDY